MVRESWSPDELKIVEYLRFRGHHVERLEPTADHGVPTADALVDNVETEFKSLQSNESRESRGEPPASVNSLINAAHRSERQADVVVIDVRNVPLSSADAEEALRRLKGSPQISSEQVRFIGNGFDIAGGVR